MGLEGNVRTQAGVCLICPPSSSSPILFTCLNSLKGALCVLIYEVGGGRESRKGDCQSLHLLFRNGKHGKGNKKTTLSVNIGSLGGFTYSREMPCILWLAFSVWLLLPTSEAGRQMPKLSDKKLCADSECSHPILIARALQDYYPGDCRFIPIRQGQLIYVYAMLKDRGNLFWAGSVQDSYYGQQEARIGHFPSSVVEETHPLMPATTEVKTTKWDFYCN